MSKSNTGAVVVTATTEGLVDDQPKSAPVGRPAKDTGIAAATPLEAIVVFRDRVYTSRTLFLPDDRQLKVAKGLVWVAESDSIGRQYLDDHVDFKPLPE